MHKKQDEKFKRRTRAFANADTVEWQRHIENPELINELKKIRDRNDLPIQIRGTKHIAAKEVLDWMGWNESIKVNKSKGELILGAKAQRREKVRSEVSELMVRFGIPRKYFDALHQMVLIDNKGLHRWDVGFPSFRARKDENGKLIYQCIITPETDLGNPAILDFIKRWQVLQRDAIPHPQPMRDNKRKLDWRPVWEWRNRHPDVSDAEIAKLLGKNRVTVSRSLEKLDKENPLQK